MWIAIIIIGGLVIWFSVKSSRANKERSEKIARRTAVTYEPRSLSTGILDDEVMDVFIAGLGHHCTMDDIGPFAGIVFNETDNPVDKKAMTIGCQRRKKILGYVPNAVLADYRKWCKREKRPCAGFIFWDGEHLRGRCRVYPTCEDGDLKKFNEDGEKYVKLVAEHFGWELNDDWTIK